MHTQSAEDTASSVIPPIQPTMPWRVTAVRPLDDYRFHVRFLDGLESEVDR
ncbi:hypothetical protein [Nitrosospira sp. Nsp13]|uniref:hypothetical protein n=1 Tax=Nitrosospira sp. Nsp13 TaxID=1855332 RepID=UPI001585F3D3|nr:hypothetical protein [Nitrosospira sp. Nsp13]